MAYTTIKKPSDYFNTKLYTGNGSTQSITGVGFQPDWTWLKNRSVTQNHELYDAVRGVTKAINSNTTNAETTYTNGLNAFGTDGFTVGDSGYINGNGNSIASWNWKANGAGSANTDGSISSTVSANTTSGFSIVKWTGTGASQSNVTIGHGLGAVPKVVLFKQLDTGSWIVYHETLGTNKYLVLDTNAAEASATGLCNPTSTNIVLETSYSGTNSTAGMIAYCFAEKQGFSKFGSYNGNNNPTDGVFIYTGFKPAFLLVKDSQFGQYWHIFDNKREPFNDDDAPHLAPNTNASEATVRTDRGVAKLDFLSNGFKWRTDNSGFNGTNKYIYMAFAEEPLVGDNPATAR